VYDRVGNAFNGDIEDTSVHGDGDNADSGSNNNYVAYNPGGISNNSTLNGATWDSTEDINSSSDNHHLPIPL